jgi:hypothetical protein
VDGFSTGTSVPKMWVLSIDINANGKLVLHGGDGQSIVARRK